MVQNNSLNTGLYFAYEKIYIRCGIESLSKTVAPSLLEWKLRNYFTMYYFVDQLEELILSEAIKYLQI